MASNYGWNKNYIDEKVYFDDLYELVQQANKRKVSDWKMELAIASNPHVKDPKELWEVLNAYDRQEKDTGKLDKAGFAMLKDKMRHNTKFIVK